MLFCMIGWQKDCEMQELNVITKIKYGSHLYGTSTPDSDLDIKGVFMPSKEEIILNRIPKSLPFNKKVSDGARNTSEDTDIEMYSLHYFIELACEGQTVALDLLHAPDNMILETSDVWKELIERRQEFYTKNLQAFVRYARRQASKYGVKGSRLIAAKKVIDILSDPLYLGSEPVTNIWKFLPEEEHLHHLGENQNGIRQYQVCGKIIQETVSIDYATEMIQKFYDSYGARARKAETNQGLDWDAISHSIRAAYEIEEILTEGTITFPLKEASFIKDIKQGKLHYIKEVAPVLEELMERIEELTLVSMLPEKVNRKVWDQFIINTISKEYGWVC